MFKNLFSTEKDIDTLVAELRKPGSDAEIVYNLYKSIVVKSVARGLVTGAVIGSAIGVTIGGLYLYKQAINPND